MVSVAIAAEMKTNRSCGALVKQCCLAQGGRLQISHQLKAITVREREHESGAGAAFLSSCFFQQSSQARTWAKS